MSLTHTYLSVPVLHQELLPDTPPLPRLCPGLPGMQEGYISLEWPMNPHTALATLRDIEGLAQSGFDAETLRIRQRMEEEQAQLRREHEEARKALGTLPQEKTPRLEERRRQAQRALIAVWAQEASLLEVDTLNHQAGAVSASLALALGEEAASLVAPAAPSILPAVDASMLPDWHTVLEHMAHFLPEGALLCTADTRMASDLKERGLITHTGEEPDFPHAAGQAVPVLAGGYAPLWQMLGYPRPVPEKPWLDAAYAFRIIPGGRHA